MQLRQILTELLRRTPFFAAAREFYISLSPRFRAQRRIEEADLRRIVGQVGTLLQTPLCTGSGKLKKVLFMGMGRVRFIAQEAVVRKAFEMAGYRPIVLISQDRLIIKAYGLLGSNDLAFLDTYLSGRRLDGADLLTESSTLDELTSLSVNGVRCGKYAASTLMRKTRSGSFDFSDDGTRRELIKALNRSLEVTAAAEALINDIAPDVLVLVDRGYSPSGELFDTCVQYNIPVITWNAAHKNNTLMLKRYTADNRDVHPSSLSNKSWEKLKTMQWTPSHWETLKLELVTCYDTGEWYSEVGTQFNTTNLSEAQLIERLGIDANKKTAVIFPHIFWDATFFWGSDLFENYEEWFIETVKAACANDRLNWIIKVHPANLVKDRRDGVSGEHSELAAIRRVVGELPLPPHVKLLPADTDISTLSLYSIMDLCVTVRGTVGIEAACFGIPVVTAGTGRFDRMGFTLDPDSKQEYLARLESADAVQPLDAHQTELARRYAYGILMQRPVALQMVNMKYRASETADLDIEFRARTIAELTASEDIRSIADWITGGGEDYLNPRAAGDNSCQPLAGAVAESRAHERRPVRELRWTDELVSRFWDYEAHFPTHYFMYQYGGDLIPQIKKFLAGRHTILDFGCGTGDLIPHLAKLGLLVTAADFSNESVAGVQAKLRNLPNFQGAFHVDDILDLGSRFDVILVVEVIEHLSDEYLARTFSIVKKLLSEQGVVIFTTPNDEELAREQVYCPQCEHTFHRWQHVRSWSAESLAAMFRKQGLDTVEVFTADFSLSPNDGWVQYLLRRFARIIRGRKPPHLIGVGRKAV